LKNRKKIISAIAVLLVCAVGLVFGAQLWTQTLPSTVTLTASSSLALFNEFACTTPATSVNIPSFDRLDVTWHNASIVYVKYTGSSEISTGKLINLIGSTVPTGFTVRWYYSQDNGVTWSTAFTLAQYTAYTCTFGKVTEISIQVKTDGTLAEGTYNSFSFVFNLSN